MAHFNTDGSSRDPWQHLTSNAARMRLPNRAVLTKEGPFGRHRPEPEVVEHMLDDLEGRMRNYFLLYSRERDARKQREDQCYRLEQELLEERRKLDQAQAKIEHMDSKIKALIGQPIKIKQTLDKIELLYNQLDTLIQAFVGVGSCATLQCQNRTAFIRLFLEYLYPCRDLDVRLNTLYTAMYASLSYGGNAPPPNEILASKEAERLKESPQAKLLSGLYIVVHQLMLRKVITNPEPNSYSCIFRYDHEPSNIAESIPSRVLHVVARPLDNTSGIIEFNGCIQVDQLPPRIPNVIPKLILEVSTDIEAIGTATVSIIDDRTLKSREPWAVCDAKGNQCGDVIVSIRPNPEGAKLPAVGFARRQDEVLLSTSKPADTEQTSQFTPTVPDKVVQQEVKPAVQSVTKPPSFSKPMTSSVSEVPKVTQDKPFEPKQKAVFRKPLFLKSKAAPKPTPLGGGIKKEEAPQEANPVPDKPDEPAPVPSPVVSKSPPAKQPDTAAEVPKTKSAPAIPKIAPKAPEDVVPAKTPPSKVVTKVPIPLKSTPPPIAPKIAVKPPTPPLPEAKAPAVTPKEAAPVEVEAPVIAPKVALKKPAMGILPKTVLPKVPPAETAPKAATGQPLIPIIVKPKILLKKPLTPKKA